MLQLIKEFALLESAVRGRLGEPGCETELDATRYVEDVCEDFVREGGRVADALLAAAGLPAGSSADQFAAAVAWHIVDNECFEHSAPEAGRPRALPGSRREYNAWRSSVAAAALADGVG